MQTPKTAAESGKTAPFFLSALILFVIGLLTTVGIVRYPVELVRLPALLVLGEHFVHTVLEGPLFLAVEWELLGRFHRFWWGLALGAIVASRARHEPTQHRGALVLIVIFVWLLLEMIGPSP